MGRKLANFWVPKDRASYFVCVKMSVFKSGFAETKLFMCVNFVSKFPASVMTFLSCEGS